MRIREYLSGKTLFITGATGFLGQPFVEKILWTAPDVRRIFVLIRPKHHFGGRILTAQERLEKELYESSVFERLQMRLQGGFQDFLREKLIALSGDIAGPNLGLSAKDQALLRSEVDIVVNSAAVVSFDAPIDQALELNVFGAKRVAEFAVSCEKAVLMHVSTAYVCGAATGTVPETLHHKAVPAMGNEQFPIRAFSDPELDIASIRALVERVREEAEAPELRRKFAAAFLRTKSKGRRRVRRDTEIASLRKRWLANHLAEEGMKWARQRGWNDTYTYTKALGEQLVSRFQKQISMVIIRPSVIESSLSEPAPGWLDGLRMADPLIVAIGKGRLRALPLNPDVALDLVPADMVVNAMLAMLPRIETPSEELRILQVATSSTNPITLRSLYELILEYFHGNPMLDKAGKPVVLKRLRFPSPAAFRIQHHLKAFPLGTAEKTLARLPAMDMTQKVKRRVSATKAAYERLYYYGELYEPYLNLNCEFSVKNTLRLFEELPSDEQKEFNFDVSALNWRHYVQNVHIPGVKKHILKMEGSGAFEPAEDQLSAAMPQTIRELLEQTVARIPDQVALQIKRKDKWVRFTFRQVQELAGQIADRLHSAGLRKGDRVVLFSENQPEWGIAYLGASFLGLVVVPLDSQTWHKEVWSVTEFTEARALLLSNKCLERLTEDELRRNEAEEHPVQLFNVDDFCRPFNLDGYPRSSKPEMHSGPAYRPELDPEDPVSIIFTTGTAVDPKGAVHSHRSFLNNLQGVNRYLSVGEKDRLLSVLPLYHALEFSCGFLMPLHRGASVTYLHSLKPRVILETMRETETTTLLGVPTLFALIRDDIERRILKSSKSLLKNNVMRTSRRLSESVEERFGHNLGRRLFARVHEEFGGHVRVFVSGGSALGRGLYRDFKAMGLPIYEGYGLTETAPVLTVNPLHRSREGSAGKPLPGVELRLYRPDRDGIGEIIVRSPSIMQEYFKNPDATRLAFRDGWFHTGDLGWVDADGYVYITGRCKDVIVTGAGKNVYPVDLEAIYRSLASVEEICVVGLKSGLTEDVHAIIVPADGTPDADTDAQLKKVIQREIQELAKELPSYHRLQQIHIWREPLPRTEEGALDRSAIRSWVAAEVSGIPRTAAARPAMELSRREKLFLELNRLSGVDLQEIDEETNLYIDLGLDSLLAVELLLFIERDLGISVSDERIPSFQTVGDVMDELRRQGASTGAAGAVERVRSALPYAERPTIDRALLGASFSTLKTLFRRYFQLTIANPQILPLDRPYIVAANHSSHLDSVAVISALSLALGVKEAQRIHVIGARDYFFNSPLKGWLFSTCLNVVPIERDEIGLSGLRMVGSILAQGEPVLIFPEGTRSRTGELQEFKPGVGLIAWEYQVPIVPAFIKGAFQAMPAGKNLPKAHPIEVRFGELVQMENYREFAATASRDEVYRKIAGDLRSTIVSLMIDQKARV